MWSPDGKRILFLCMSTVRGPSDLCVMNVDGTDQRRLTSDGSSVHGVWSPDGFEIAYESDRDICVMNAHGSNKKQLTTHPGYDGQPTWSPDGTKIAFVSDRDGNDEIYVMNADGTNKINVSNNPGRDFSPVWAATPVP